MNNVNMANMNMGGPVGGASMPMMNNGAVAPQTAPRQLQVNDTPHNRTLLNTYIYEYFLRYGMFDCARAILNSDSQVKVQKDSPGARRDENGNILGNGLGDDPMDTDNKDELDAKRPEDLPAANVPTPLPDSCFLFEWFCLFWDMFNAQKGNKGAGAPQVHQYVSHTQQQSRQRQAEQQQLLRQMRPEFSQQYQAQVMRSMQNGAMNINMNMKPGNNLPRTAMANSQNNPQAMQQMIQQKQGQMQRDPSDMDGNRARPASPGSTDNAPSPSKRPRLEGAPFPNQGAMMPNGRPAAQGMPGQQVGTGPNTTQVEQMLLTNGINPGALNSGQFQTFSNQTPAVQAKTIATYAANLQQHQGNQMLSKPMPNTAGPQAQGSPMVPQGPDGATLNTFYNPGDMAGPGGMRPGPNPGQAAGGSNHALQDYQMQLMLLEQQNKKRLMMARQEQEVGGIPRPDGPAGPGGPGGPGAPPNPNAPPFQGTSPQGTRSGASPNPTEQMKRGGQQMSNAGMGSPLPDSRGSPNPINFMGNQMDPNQAPHFYKGMNGMENNMVTAAQMNGMRPPNAHPGQPFNGQMNQQQMMAAARQQQQAAQGGGQQIQWPGGPNGNQLAGPQGHQGQVQGTPQQRSMPPPSAPTAANNNVNSRNATSSPQTTTAAPPTPQQSNKANPKKKDAKGAKNKAAAQKKTNSTANAAGATPAAEPPVEPEPPTPATPITPVNPASFAGKLAQNATAAPSAANGQQTAPATQAAAPVPPPHTDPTQGAYAIPDTGAMDFTNMDFANPLTSGDVLEFDFDQFLHDNNEDPTGYDFAGGSFPLEGGEIGAE